MSNARDISNIKEAQVAKAWVVFNSLTTTPTIADDYNVTSITDRGVGRYTVNFTSAMASANYSASAIYGNGHGVDTINTHGVGQETVLTSSAYGIRVTQNDTAIDKALNSVIFFAN